MSIHVHELSNLKSKNWGHSEIVICQNFCQFPYPTQFLRTCMRRYSLIVSRERLFQEETEREEAYLFSKFIPKIPAMAPIIVTANVPAEMSNSNCNISLKLIITLLISES